MRSSTSLKVSTTTIAGTQRSATILRFSSNEVRRSSSDPTLICPRNRGKPKVEFHCFIRTEGPGPASYSLFPDSEANLCTGLGAYGIPTRNDPSDLNAVTPHCRSTGDCGNIRQCIENVFNGYPRGSYKVFGPNSNTFAATVARVCGLKVPAVANGNDAPGWSSNPPQPF